MQHSAKPLAEQDSAVPSPELLPKIHIQLDNEAAANENNIFPIRNYLEDNKGNCTVYIHIGEKTIQVNSGISHLVVQNAVGILENCAGVIKVWIEQ